MKEAAERRMIVPVPFAPRPRFAIAPGLTFYLRYTGIQHPWFDDQGCVKCVINSCGIRDREALCRPKPAGQRRVVCLGDSFTFGWGVPVEDAWPRRVEHVLRATDDQIRTVNCGMTYGLFLDEQRAGLEHDAARFEPDAVLVTVCLNDLLPTSQTLAEQEPMPWLMRQSRILRDLFQGYALQGTLALDPDRDVVQELLDLPEAQYPPWAQPGGTTRIGKAALWAGGGPQAALVGMRDWCRQRHLPYGVVLWPYFQGLGRGEHYPFTKMHRLVAEFCKAHEIPFLDVLPELEGSVPRTSDLWVSPADYHGNVTAHELATPAIATFVGRILGLGD